LNFAVVERFGRVFYSKFLLYFCDVSDVVLSGARRRWSACGSVDVTATHHLLLH